MPAADASSSENMSNETLGCFSGNERTDNKRESEGGKFYINNLHSDYYIRF